jgi:hypothetical protein
MAADSVSVKLDFEARAAMRAMADAARSLKGVEDGAKGADGAVLRFGRALNNVASSSLVGYAQAALSMGAAIRDGAIAHEQSTAQIRAAGPAYQAMAAATRGAITASQALAVQQRFQSAQLRVNKDDFGLVARAAREYAIATGTDASEALTTLSSAIASNDRTALQPFGITLRRNTTATQGLRDALRQLEQQQRNTAPAAQTLQEANEQLSRSWTDLTQSIFASIARWADLQSNIAGVADAIRQVTAAHGDLSVLVGGGREAQQSAAGTAAMNSRLDLREQYQRRVAEMRSTLPESLNSRVQFGRDVDLSDAQISDFLRRTTSASSGALGMDEIQAFAQETLGTERGNLDLRAERDARRAREAQEEARRRVANRASTATGSYDASTFEFIDQLNDLIRNARGARLLLVPETQLGYRTSLAQAGEVLQSASGAFAGEQVGRVRRRPGESQRDYLSRLMAASQGDLQSAIERQTGKQGGQYEANVAGSAADRARLDAQRAMDPTSAAGVIDEGLGGKIAGFRESQDALARSQSFGAQFADQFLPAAEQTRTAAEKMAEGVKGAFDTMTGAITTHIQALVEGRETFGEAMRGIVHDTLIGVAQQAVPKALFETAQGIASLAMGNVPGATLHFASAGAYAGVAALAGLGAAATAPAAAGASAQGAGAQAALRAPASAGQLGSGGSRGPAQVVINVNGAVIDREGLEEAVGEAWRGAQSRGLLAA